MNTSTCRPITPDEIATYHRDGVVMLTSMFDADWINLLRKGLERNCQHPTYRSRTWDRDHENRTMFWDSQAWQTIPDIDADPEKFGVISWDMQPGDCVVFNSRIIHGGSGKLAPDQDLSVFTTKWLGDDVRIVFREHGMDPDHSSIMTEYGLQPGDRPGTDLYPCIWSRTASP